MIFCGMVMKRVGVLGVSVRKTKALTMKIETVTNWQREIESDVLFVLNV